ncbi:hypothetical protein [Micromonospora sp.]|uniref:hypothetical protein n=1 Tax=Micromonospora sp. TaxID=1876 RepID=UPI003B3B0779
MSPRFELPSWFRRLMPDLGVLDPLTRRGPAADAIAVGALVVMVVAAVGTVRTGRWYWRALLLAGALVWPLPDHPFQGPILLDLSYRHGVHLADLLSVVAAVVAILPWRRLRRSDAVS